MKKIWKFTLTQPLNAISMPKGARLLDAQMQGNVLVLWALVDPDAEKVIRDILLCGTGNTIHEAFAYVATVQVPPFVWHVFDGGENG